MSNLDQARLALGIATATYKASRDSKNRYGQLYRDMVDAEKLVNHLEASKKREDYLFTVGPDRGYIGAVSSSNGGITFDIIDGTHEQATVSLTHEQAEHLYSSLGKALGH